MNTGDKVVCIKSNFHPGGAIENEIYTIKNTRTDFCKCHNLDIDIGITNPDNIMKCTVCTTIVCSKIWWHDSINFVPLDEWEQAEEAVNELFEPIKITL